MIFDLKKLFIWFIFAGIALPFLYLLMLSFSTYWAYPNVIPQNITLNNWTKIFSVNANLLSSFGISVLISLSVAAIATICGFISSKFIAYHPKKRTLMLMSYFPFILSPVIYAACIYYFFIVMNISGSIIGVILAQLIIAYPYAVIIFSGFWSNEIKSMEDLVTTLGGNKLQAYTKVLFPSAKGMALVCFFQTYLISWFEYGLTTIIGVGKVQTLTLKVFQYINEANIYFAALAACMLIIPPVILLYVNKKFVFKVNG